MILGGSNIIHAAAIARLAGPLRGFVTTGWVMLFGAIGWPWLLRSRSGGGAAARADLLRLIELPDHALPARLGGWRGDALFLGHLAGIVLRDRPAQVIELGGGTTTLVIAQALHLAGGGRLTSIDGDRGFADETRALLAAQGLSADVRAVPLATPPGGWPGEWYDHGPLPDVIDLLVVDGPPWALHPLVRGAAASLFDRIPIGGRVMLDDAARPGERLVARRWARAWPGFTWHRLAGPAGTLVGTRNA